MGKLLIFDFDGTIADTKSVYYLVIGNELERFGFSRKRTVYFIDLGMNLKKTLKKMGFSFLWRFFLHKRITKKVEKHAGEVGKCKDVYSIQLIKTRKILVTNSLKEFAVPILKKFNLKKEFKEIYGAEDFADKEDFIRDYIKERKLKKENCYYIGDRVADIKLAKKVGCKSIVIIGKCSWDSKSDLLKENPDFVVDSLKDIKKIAS